LSGEKNQLLDQIGLCLQHGLGKKGGLKNVSLKRGEMGWGNCCSNKKREGEIFPHPRLKVINLCLASLKALSSEKKISLKKSKKSNKIGKNFFYGNDAFKCSEHRNYIMMNLCQKGMTKSNM
jgi:hypothetical protein